MDEMNLNEINYYTIKEVAEILKLSAARVRKLAQEGRITGAIQIGRMWLIVKHEDRPIEITNKMKGPRPAWSKVSLQSDKE